MIIKQLFIGVTSCSICACVSISTESRTDEYVSESTGSDCIFEGTIRDYRVLDESNLLVTASAKRKYHIELTRRAFGLESSWHIGFTSPTSRICPGFSEVIVDEGFGPEAIRISKIWAIGPDEYEDLLIRYGKMEPEITQPPATQEVEGAEVEELD